MLARGYCTKHYHEMFRHERYERNKSKELTATKLRNKLKRQELLKKLHFSGKCARCNVLINLSKKRASFVVDDKVLCFKCWNESRKVKKFSRDYKKCKKCGSTDGKHAGHGLCVKCYSEIRRGN